MNPGIGRISFSIVVVVAASLWLPGCFRSRSEIARENEDKEVRTSLQRTVYEQNKELDGLREEIGKLEGRLEELEHERKKEYGALSSSREGTEKNLSALHERLEQVQKNQEALFEEIKKIKEEDVRALRTERGEAPSSVKKNKSASFESALGNFKSKDFEVAADDFREYLERNPKSKKAVEARYYLGESLFQLKEYSEAIVELGFVHERGQTSPLGRKSTLRIAESFKALGKDKDARAFAQILLDKSPSSAEAKAARKLLR